MKYTLSNAAVVGILTVAMESPAVALTLFPLPAVVVEVPLPPPPPHPTIAIAVPARKIGHFFNTGSPRSRAELLLRLSPESAVSIASFAATNQDVLSARFSFDATRALSVTPKDGCG